MAFAGLAEVAALADRDARAVEEVLVRRRVLGKLETATVEPREIRPLWGVVADAVLGRPLGDALPVAIEIRHHHFEPLGAVTPRRDGRRHPDATWSAEQVLRDPRLKARFQLG